MSRKLSPQGKAGRKVLSAKVETECIEDGCDNIIVTNRGNAARGVRCVEHRKELLRRKARERYKKSNEPNVAYERLAQLRNLVVMIKCRNNFCNTLVETDGLSARRPQGVYCDECRYEAKQISDHNYYANRGKNLRQKRQERDAA